LEKSEKNIIFVVYYDVDGLDSTDVKRFGQEKNGQKYKRLAKCL